jgi:sialate O-acetylesterase
MEVVSQIRRLARCVVLLGFALCLADRCPADISLATIFSDHMVLQQNSSVKIWGKAEPGDEIVVTFVDQTALGTANARGQWSVTIHTPKAGGPFKLEVCVKGGEPKIVLTDVLVGEVWICSGQSNMEMPVEAASNPEKEIDAAKEFSNIRLFTIEHHAMNQAQTEFGRCEQWSVCSPESIRSFSATAYFFGRKLNRELNVPIGLIDSTWGGTTIEAWTSMEALQDVPEFEPLLKHWREIEDPTNPNRPANLFNGMISPLRGFVLRGVIWYQGEANVERGRQYAQIFPRMIGCWRKTLAEGRPFPFLFVQLAPFRYPSAPAEALPELWDAQLKTFRTVQDVGMVVTTDIGNIRDIHPGNKQDVGDRLANWALEKCYQDLRPDDASPIQHSGPIYRSSQVDGSLIRIEFDSASGLKTKDDEAPTHFSICGSDGKFVSAVAKIEGETVIVKAPEVSEPVAVRFAWTDTAEPNLVNGAGLPASPFRTDDFKLLSNDRDY